MLFHHTGQMNSDAFLKWFQSLNLNFEKEFHLQYSNFKVTFVNGKEVAKVRTIIAYMHYFEVFLEEKTIGLI